MLERWQLRAAFAHRLSKMYGGEVPAYLALVETTAAVNAEVLADRGAEAERLGGADRVSAERHGAIRVGNARELGQVARLFAAVGMHPVGYYDLRDSGVPVVSTAFRPIDADELERNPFRVFTSVLATDDRRFFTSDLAARIRRRLDERELFPPSLLALADLCDANSGLGEQDAALFLGQLTDAFRVSTEPIDRGWYDELQSVSAVAADVAGGPTTHINHLTPRVLDIDELQSRMNARGIEMIPEIQGPPAWDGPDVLLRQTSFKALAEERMFRERDGSVARGQLRVRFGEVEARGIALTPLGRDRYASAMQGTWEEWFPRTERDLFVDGLGVFRVAPVAGRANDGRPLESDLKSLLDTGFVTLEPVVYEDFLPRSAAGIFRSNLDADPDSDRIGDASGDGHDRDWLGGALGRELLDPDRLYADITDRSLQTAAASFGIPVPKLTGSFACT